MRARYETSADQVARLRRDAEKFAEGHARLIATDGDHFKVKTSRNLFRAKIYHERLPPAQFDEIMDLFESSVGERLDALLTELHESA
jgi:hypothetical protein